MTVAELKAALEKMPQDATVIRWYTNNDGLDLLVEASDVKHDADCKWENCRERPRSGSAVIIN